MKKDVKHVALVASKFKEITSELLKDLNDPDEFVQLLTYDKIISLLLHFKSQQEIIRMSMNTSTYAAIKGSEGTASECALTYTKNMTHPFFEDEDKDEEDDNLQKLLSSLKELSRAMQK